MERYIFVEDVEEGNFLVRTKDAKQADDLLNQYNDPCNFGGWAQELVETVARILIAHNIDNWPDYGGFVYELELI